VTNQAPSLTDEQKGQICGILSVGCDRETAAGFVGRSAADVGRAMQQDPTFAANVLRTEAGIELTHMRSVHKAAEDAKNWRASVWWLERHAPERYGARSAGAVTMRQLDAFLDTIVDVLCEEFPDGEIRRRVLARFDQAIRALEESVCFAVTGVGADDGGWLAGDLFGGSENGLANLLQAPEDK
jgi:hypothetical protein